MWAGQRGIAKVCEFLKWGRGGCGGGDENDMASGHDVGSG